MRKLIIKSSISFDGFVAAQDKRLDWIFASTDEGATAWTMATIRDAGLHIMGSNTFHDMAGHWPGSTAVFAAPMNDIPKAVFSKDPHTTAREKWSKPASIDAKTGSRSPATATSAPPEKERSWLEARVLTGDLETEIAALKREPGKEIVAHGGASFVQQLAKHGLVDEYHLLVHPVALGNGFGLFAELSRPVKLALIRVITFDSGAVAHVYRPA